MASASSPFQLSIPDAVLFPFSLISCTLIIPIWIAQARDNHRHHALSILFVWLLLGFILDILNPFLLRSDQLSASQLDLRDVGNEFITNGSALPLSFDSRTILGSKGTEQLGSIRLSGYTTLSVVALIARSNPDVRQHLASMQACVLSAHLDEIRWLAVCVCLLKWSYYLYSCLNRRLGVVNPRLMAAIAENDSIPRTGHTDSAMDPEFTTGFRLRRSFRSLPDFWMLLPLFVIAPFMLIGVMLRTTLRNCLGCFRAGEDISDIGQGHDKELDAWSKRAGSRNDDDIEIGDLLPSNQAPVIPDVVQRAAVQASSSPTILEQPSSSLAAKLHVQHVDLNETNEENFSYDITGDKIRYRKDLWTNKLKKTFFAHWQLVWDIVVCVVFPVVMFLFLFFFKAENRSYEVYPDRGGCRVSRTSGRADWIRVLLLQAVIAATALLGLIFAALATYKFKTQNGTLDINVKRLTPSPEVLRIYKSAKAVQHLLILCVSLDIIFALSCIVNLGLYEFHPNLTDAASEPTLSSIDELTNFTMGSAGYLSTNMTGTTQPYMLFQKARLDYDVYHGVVACILVILSFLFVLWTRLRRWKTFLCGCIHAESEEEMSCEQDVHVFPFPFDLTLSSEHPVSISKDLSGTGSASTTRRLDTVFLEGAVSDRFLEAGSVLNHVTEEHNPHWDIKARRYSLSGRGSLEEDRRELQSSTATGSQGAVCVYYYEPFKTDNDLGAGVGHEMDNIKLDTESPLQARTSAVVGRERYSSSWLPSVPVHGHTFTKSSRGRGGRVIDQCPQLSQQTLPFSGSNLAISASVPTSLPVPGVESSRKPWPRKAREDSYSNSTITDTSCLPVPSPAAIAVSLSDVPAANVRSESKSASDPSVFQLQTSSLTYSHADRLNRRLRLLPLTQSARKDIESGINISACEENCAGTSRKTRLFKTQAATDFFMTLMPRRRQVMEDTIAVLRSELEIRFLSPASSAASECNPADPDSPMMPPEIQTVGLSSHPESSIGVSTTSAQVDMSCGGNEELYALNSKTLGSQVYCAQLDRMIDLPKGTPPSDTRQQLNSTMRRKPSVHQLNISGHERAANVQQSSLSLAPSMVQPLTQLSIPRRSL